MMQRLTREYLDLSLEPKTSADVEAKNNDLKSQAFHFNQRLTRIQKELSKHPHAGQPLQQSLTAWQYIINSIESFPAKPVPMMVVRYGDRIVKKLSSVQRMF